MDIYQCVVSCCGIICLTVVVVSYIERKKPRANHGCENYKEKIEQGYDII
jgi:hypothetical protein